MSEATFSPNRFVTYYITNRSRSDGGVSSGKRATYRIPFVTYYVTNALGLRGGAQGDCHGF